MYVSLYLNYCYILYLFFFFHDTATTEIYTLSLHDALPILRKQAEQEIPLRITLVRPPSGVVFCLQRGRADLVSPTEAAGERSEEHTSELQSLAYLVCRLLLTKKKKK